MTHGLLGRRRRAALAAWAIALGSLATAAPAVPQSRAVGRPPALGPEGAATPRRIDHELELALADSSIWLEYRTPFDRSDGQFAGRFFANNDGDVVLNGKLQRWGPASEELELGVGFGAYAAFVDEPNDTVLALALTGGARYRLPTRMPTRLAAQLALAPRITTFSAGEGVLDFDVRWEADVNEFATVFAGYRVLEVNLEDESVQDELDSSLQVGVRLGF